VVGIRLNKMEVRARKSESSENLIKRFIRKCKKTKIIEEVLDRRFYKKPSEIKREEKARSIAKYEKERRKKELLEKE